MDALSLIHIYLFITRYGARVRDGEGRFITFYFIIFYTISFFIFKKNTKVINLPSPSLTLDPVSYTHLDVYKRQ